MVIDFNSTRLLFIPISGIDGIITTSLISNATATPRTVANQPYAVLTYTDTSGAVWAVSVDRTSNRLSFIAIVQPPLNYLSTDLLTSYFVTSNNLAQISASISALEFVVGTEGSATDSNYFVFGRLYDFVYSGTKSAPSGTLSGGNQIRLTTSTADIAEITVTLASGSTLRLGKKAGPYTMGLVAQSGSTIEVYPDSDRSGSAPLNLRNQTIASGTTINVTSGTATVLSTSATGITAGSGVTLQLVQPILTLIGFPAGSQVIVSQAGVQRNLVNNQSPPYTYTKLAADSPFHDVTINATGYKPYTATINLAVDSTIPVAMIAESSTQTVDANLAAFGRLMSSNTKVRAMITQALGVAGLVDEATILQIGAWRTAAHKAAWNAVVVHGSITAPSGGEIAAWSALVVSTGVTGISFNGTTGGY